MITFGEELKSATNAVHPKIQHNRLTLDILSTLQSSDFLVSKHPFRIEMKNITPQDVTIMSNLDIPVVDKKIKHIIVELLQNIVIKQSQKHAKKSHFVLEQKDDTLHIEVSNYLENVINGNDKIGEITRRIEEVNSMDTQEIKELYREKLGDAKFTETGGGGLGFVDIAKKIKSLDPSMEKIFNYSFTPTEEENISEFSLEIDIPIGEKEKEKLAS